MAKIDDIIHYYENLDTTDFPIIEPEVLKKLKQNKATFLEQQITALDKIKTQNPSAKRKIYVKP